AWALTIGALRPIARSPRPASPRIQFLYIGPRFRSPLPSHGWSPFRSCGSLRLGWSPFGGTCTRKTAPMLGAQRRRGSPSRASPFVAERFRADSEVAHLLADLSDG